MPSSDAKPTAETSQSKGDRLENEAKQILGRTYGSPNVDKVSRYSNNDPLRFLDVLAAKDGYPVRFVQVKANRFTKKRRRNYTQTVKRFPDDVVCEVWVRVDYQGWEIYQFNPETEEWDEFLCVDSCDQEDTVEAFREAVGFYEEAKASA